MMVPVGSCQVDPQAPNFCGQQEDKHLFVGVEVIHKAGPEADGSGAVHAVIAVPRLLHCLLQYVQHLLCLSEHQGTVPLLMPVLQNLQCKQPEIEDDPFVMLDLLCLCEG